MAKRTGVPGTEVQGGEGTKSTYCYESSMSGSEECAYTCTSVHGSKRGPAIRAWRATGQELADIMCLPVSSQGLHARFLSRSHKMHFG